METTNKIGIREAVNCKTLIVFNNETKLKFWEDEMVGQISDGMWENSRNTDWLWRDSLAVLIPDGTIPEGVYVSSTYTIGRKTYPWFKQLEEIIEYHKYGFDNIREAKAMWKSIADMISNPQLKPEYITLFNNWGKSEQKKLIDKIPVKLIELGFEQVEDKVWGTEYRRVIYTDPLNSNKTVEFKISAAYLKKYNADERPRIPVEIEDNTYKMLLPLSNVGYKGQPFVVVCDSSDDYKKLSEYLSATELYIKMLNKLQ